jgi:hypothetical protein
MCSTMIHMQNEICLTKYLQQILKSCFHAVKCIHLEDPQWVEHTVIISLKYECTFQ